MNDLTGIIDHADFTLVAVVIDKRRLAARYVNPAHPYHLSMEFGLERLYRLMRHNDQADKLIYVVCESRGKKEDDELELEFRRIQGGDNYFRTSLPFDIIIVDKKTNSEGLQLADLTARLIGCHKREFLLRFRRDRQRWQHWLLFTSWQSMLATGCPAPFLAVGNQPHRPGI